jgi:hypothetical protein
MKNSIKSKRPATYESIRQRIFSAKTEKEAKFWEDVLKKLEADPPPKPKKNQAQKS